MFVTGKTGDDEMNTLSYKVTCDDPSTIKD